MDGERFFPGSRQPIRPPAGLPSAVVIPPEFGKEFTIGGNKITLYTIGELAQVLERQPVTIRKWERLGTIPKATFVKPGANKDPRGKRRLYSREQVEALLRIAMEEKILYNPNVQISKTQFTAKVTQAFKELVVSR